MPKNCKPNRSLKHAEAWSHEELQRRRELKVEKLKRKHISQEKEANDNADGGKDAYATNNDNNSNNVPFSLKRQMLLAHDTEDKKEKDKLRLHISKLNRNVEILRNRLTNWDEKEEEERAKQEEKKEADNERIRLEKEELLLHGRRLIKKRRPGPETWKLRGAARPAWEVYDFDTRYECPFIKEHEEAKEKVKRIQNILCLYRGKMQDGPKPHCYNFVMSLCQLGHLCYEDHKYSKARQAWIECIDLEGADVVMTNARYRLIRMYMKLGRAQSVNRLCTDLSSSSNTTKSAWIQYSALLLTYQTFNNNNTDADTPSTSKQLLQEALQNAIASNIYCIFYLAFHDTAFNNDVMEYTDDIEDVPEGTLLEAIEYCTTEQLTIWNQTNGAIQWLRTQLMSIWKDLDWESSLKKEEEDGRDDTNGVEENKNDDADGDEQDDVEEEDDIDVSMYAGMFRTGMEMLIENGQLK